MKSQCPFINRLFLCSLRGPFSLNKNTFKKIDRCCIFEIHSKNYIYLAKVSRLLFLRAEFGGNFRKGRVVLKRNHLFELSAPQ